MEITPGLIAHTLRARGLPKPNGFGDYSYLASLNASTRDELLKLILRLNNGLDRPDDMEAIIKLQSAFKKSLERDDPVSDQSSFVKDNLAVPPPVADKNKELTISKNIQAEERTRRSHHVYGKNCALCIEPVEVNRAGKSYKTLLFDIAPSLENLKYDWDNKVQFRLTPREIPFFAALMMGWMESVFFENHGRLKDKSMMVLDQRKHIFLKIQLNPRVYPIQIPSEEIFQITAITVDVLILNNPGIDSQTLMMMVKRAAGFRNA